jgi:elongation factor G
VEVQVPSAFVGSVMSDLAGRRARILGSQSDPQNDERSTVRAQLPDLELLSYAAALRGVSHGTGSFTRRPTGFEPRPSNGQSR